MRTRPFRSVSRLAALSVWCVMLLGGRAEAKHARFLGAHPIAARYGGGFCYIEAPHLHAYPPDHAALYQQVGDEYVFTGDPTPFGYEGDRHPFYGHHPVVTIAGEPVYCFLDGPHSHAFAPPEGPDYRINGGVAFYVGPFDPTYARLRSHRERLINAEYRPFVAFRPTVTVAPPPEWHGEVWVAPPTVSMEAPGVVVGAPGVSVRGPTVSVRGPGVYVGAPGVVVAAPPPPRVVVSAPGMYVGAPGVYVDGPGMVVAGPRGHGERHDGDDREHHDNGRHRGWYKHGRGD
jgi:hypothetical protein